MNPGTRAGLAIASCLLEFVEREALPGTGVTAADLWQGLAGMLAELAPVNRQLLAQRASLQQQIDTWYQGQAGAGRGPPHPEEHTELLRRIGYLVAAPGPFTIDVHNVDRELSEIPGPQLVVPVTNARYVLNAVNARWGSLYDAFYGTDVVPQGPRTGSGYDPARGAQVIARSKTVLDAAAPLAAGSHAQATRYRVSHGELQVTLGEQMTPLRHPAQFIGLRGDPAQPESILLRNHGLHIELRFAPDSAPGRADPAGIGDVLLESAVSTIVDFEDSVATVDAADKTAAYRTWLGLMKGDLSARFEKGGRSVSRTLNEDVRFSGPRGESLSLPGRALLLVRNVGLHMYTDAVRDGAGEPIPEGILDALLTSLMALHDVRAPSRTPNSRHGSIYVVKPKLHGPDEVAFSVRTFARVEAVLGLKPNTIKLGLMDEERRTSANLAACIHAARERLVFINTGFLDRTGDEIHTAMQGGAMVRKEEMRSSAWLQAYERRNVRIGLACGLHRRAQIGKGMWAAPDRMAAMLEQKIGHPRSGANTAWVPSPTAATLHALHYHEIDVLARQQELAGESDAELHALLTPPFSSRAYRPEEIRQEIDNNAQGILGYVVRWIDQGIGCSKVPDIHDVGLMEDRATLRISSQHLANWLQHGVVTAQEVHAALKRMAAVVDRQNAGDPQYRALLSHDDAPAFAAARALIFEGTRQPNGYTEFILERYRREAKANAS
ncbi:MAG: malate synthase G [Sinobacteraceae bacterium]|nr:malate synthase G [Nevskiaceae bacterium]